MHGFTSFIEFISFHIKYIKLKHQHKTTLRRLGQSQDYAPAQARRKGGAIFVWHTLAPAISQEEHLSYCSAQSRGAPALEKSLEIWSKTAKS
ncbi:hypothetical protein BB776_03600 [Planococcus salinarum]|uniref:Uncharacterized protein n=1 Tax=Planococcus salinarum TaxID=622695 RepID=A0ABX3D0Q4_9BACL|nr:hypothetical protein BB776_03600 [Planococcus salinarum]